MLFNVLITFTKHGSVALLEVENPTIFSYTAVQQLTRFQLTARRAVPLR